jgi:hypothetical protein
MIIPLLPLFPFPLTWNPPSCDRIHQPLLWVARKLTPAFLSPAHLAPYPKSRSPGVSQTRNRHSLGRRCEPTPYARLQYCFLCSWQQRAKPGLRKLTQRYELTDCTKPVKFYHPKMKCGGLNPNRNGVQSYL